MQVKLNRLTIVYCLTVYFPVGLLLFVSPYFAIVTAENALNTPRFRLAGKQ